MTARPPDNKTVFVIGPTASGKTDLGVFLAREFNGEIVSADSRQVYRGMDIGTGKDLDAYGHATDRVPLHLVDILNPGDTYNLFQFVRDAAHALNDITQRDRLPIVVGGAPLYVKALLENYELEGGPPNPGLRRKLQHCTDDQLKTRLRTEAPDVCKRTDLTQRRRIIRALEIAEARRAEPTSSHTPHLHIAPLLLAPYYERREMHARIAARLETRLQQGMIQEVQSLHENGLSWKQLDWFGLEYRWIARHLKGDISFETMKEKLFTHIRRFCKSQDGWYRRFERDGWNIHWLTHGDRQKARQLVADFLAGKHIPEPEFKLKNILYGPPSN